MSNTLQAKRIAILATDGFEQVELTEPRQALEDAGATTAVVAPREGNIKGWKFTDWGEEVAVDATLADADAGEFDALLLPGGVMNPDALRRDESALAFVREFFKTGKPVAAICHAPWTLIDAGQVAGKRMTSYHTVQTDLKNAGAQWVDEEVVVDDGLVTSRSPDDIPAFTAKMVEEFAEGKHRAATGG